MGIDNKPTVGGSDGTWGAQLNNVLDALNPTNTTGDLIYATSSSSAGNGVPGRLGVGAVNSILTVGAASALQWSSSMNLSGAATIGGLFTMSNSASLTGTLTINETAVDTTPEITLVSSSANLSIHSPLTAAASNSLVSASDNAIIFYGGASNSGALTIAPWSASQTGIRITGSNTVIISGSTTLSGGTASITGAASVLSIYSTSGSINGTLNATTLQQGGNAVPTIVTTARMAQGSVTVTTTAGGVASVSTGLTTITNFIPINGNSTSSLVFNASSTYSGGTASVLAKWFTSASTGASANGSVASAQSITINWLAFGT